MPTTSAVDYTAQRLVSFFNPEDARRITVKLPASVTYAKGTVLGELTASPGTYRNYLSGSADGSQVAKVILEYACTTDAAGLITWGNGEYYERQSGTPAYYSGTFQTADLVGLDAGAVSALGKLISGSVTDGILRMG
jgi:Bacteriophage lambda head decoration protein D